MNINGLDYNTERPKLEARGYGRIIEEMQAQVDNMDDTPQREVLQQRIDEFRQSCKETYGRGDAAANGLADSKRKKKKK